ncbi:MAG TPA: hypothetical protein VFB13_16625 [Reyranella sp.]|jgi:hypothetical protein|nr:hypothetical protein [Reyranella sp.]
MSRVLSGNIDLDILEEPLTSVALAQYDALGRRWPATARCEHIASPGCRYSIPLRVDWHEGMFKSSFCGCARIDLSVVEGKDGLPEVHRTAYGPMKCPAGFVPGPDTDRIQLVK